MADPSKSPRVNLFAPDGSPVNADAANVERLLAAGYKVARPEDVAAYQREQEYGDQDVRSFVEGAASGLTFGASDYALEGLGVSTKEELLARREVNPVASGLGEATGLIGGALLSGGTGLAAKVGGGAAGLAARAATGTARAVEGLQTARALTGAAQATTRIGRAVSAAAPLAAAGAAEGALYGAAKQVNDDWLRDHEITAERIAVGAGLNALTGGAFGAGAGVLGLLGREAVEAVGRFDAPDALKAFANQRAVKAIIGQTSKKQVKLAGRFGEDMEAGLDRVGQTLLDDAADAGLNFATASKDDLAQFAKSRREFWGQQIEQLEAKADGILGEQKVVAVNGKELADRIEAEVLNPLLQSGVSRQTGKQLKGRIKDVLDDLRTRESMTVTESRALRKEFDTYKINHAKETRTVVDDEALKVRRILEDANVKAVDQAGLADDYAKAKLRYGVSAWADKATQEVAAGDVARRFVSASDYGVGTAVGMLHGLATGGVSAGALATGFLASQGNRVLRDRGNQFVAGVLSRLTRENGATMAVRGEQALVDAADGLAANVKRGIKRSLAAVESTASVLGANLVIRDAASYERAIERVERLQDPSSVERNTLRANLAPVMEASPQTAKAIEAQVQRTADFLAKKAGPRAARVKPGEPFSHLAPPKHSEAKAARLARYARAAEDPTGALNRLKRGEVVREDIEALKELYPRLWARFGARLAANISDASERPDSESRAALALVMGTPNTQRVQALQALAKRGVGATALQQEREQAIAPSRARPPDVAGAYATRSDRLVGGME